MDRSRGATTSATMHVCDTLDVVALLASKSAELGVFTAGHVCGNSVCCCQIPACVGSAAGACSDDCVLPPNLGVQVRS